MSGAPANLPALTGIRAVAALLVLGLHADWQLPIGVGTYLPFLVRGYLGVDFFFVLSGFIITHVYLDELRRPGRAAALIFLWHRLIRLFPVHLATIFGLVLLVHIAAAAGVAPNHQQGWRVQELPWHVLLLHAWGVTSTLGWNAPSWSVSAEWFAYLLFPLLAPLLAQLRHQIIALFLGAATLAGMALLFVAMDWKIDSWIGAPALSRVMGEFLCGAFLCRAVSIGQAAGSETVGGDLIGALGFVGFLLGASFGLPDPALVGLLALTILGAATSRGAFRRVLASGVLVWLGEISYSIYMVQYPVLLLSKRFWERLGFLGWHPAGQMVAFVATVGITILLAAALYYAVERPARSRLRDRLGEL